MALPDEIERVLDEDLLYHGMYYPTFDEFKEELTKFFKKYSVPNSVIKRICAKT